MGVGGATVSEHDVGFHAFTCCIGGLILLVFGAVFVVLIEQAVTFKIQSGSVNERQA